MPIVYIQNVPFPKDALVGWNSGLGKRFRLAAREMTLMAGRNAPVRTGQLRGSIDNNTKERRQSAQGIWFNVGSKVKHALWMESGTRPHPIPKTPLPPGKFLVFFWPRVGRVVRMKSVNHPGTRAYRYLERALTLVIGRMF
ncbi:MAG TPA: hypothetical protein VIU11_21210 [Nakamurella sp.]